jgi:hypothetical protein
MAIGNIPKTKDEMRAFFDGRPGAQGGAAAGAGVSVEASKAGYTKTVLRFENVAIPLADAAGVVAHGGLKVFDLPEGLVHIAAASADLAVTKSSAGVNADWDGDFGVGTVTASNNATLSSTEQNIIPTTATPQAAAGATTAKGVSTGGVLLDGTAGAADVFLNFLVDDTDHNVAGTACNLIVNGTLTLLWALAGDK